MLAVPPTTPVTVPSGATVAMLLLLEVQVPPDTVLLAVVVLRLLLENAVRNMQGVEREAAVAAGKPQDLRLVIDDQDL